MKIFLLKDLQNSLEPQELQLSLARWEIFIFQKRNFVRLLLWKVGQDADGTELLRIPSTVSYARIGSLSEQG